MFTNVNTNSLFRTATLWKQYMEMVSLLKKYITADRTGNWELHIRMTQEMLPYLSAAGHYNYSKSCHIYLQEMFALDKSNPVVKEHFNKGLFVIRRSDNYWGGLPPDLTIEQTLMRTMKSTSKSEYNYKIGYNYYTPYNIYCLRDSVFYHCFLLLINRWFYSTERC